MPDTIKMYSDAPHEGGSPEFWESNWTENDIGQCLRFCAVDPLRPLFERYSRPGDLMLEGGCGLGQYVAYWAWRGRRVVGLDFAKRALARIKGWSPRAGLVAGDVARLPFPDETFDLYYSGGVVEHFEAGAEAALREAARVLKPGGVLLISVPYFSPLRRALLPFKRPLWTPLRGPFEAEGSPQEGHRFFQYAYAPRAFETMLAHAGLRVVERQGFAVVWGLRDLPIFGNGASTTPQRPEVRNDLPPTTPIDIAAWAQDQPISLLKRLVVSEDASVPILGLGVRCLRWFAANMMMYVCRR